MVRHKGQAPAEEEVREKAQLALERIGQGADEFAVSRNPPAIPPVLYRFSGGARTPRSGLVGGKRRSGTGPCLLVGWAWSEAGLCTVMNDSDLSRWNWGLHGEALHGLH